VNRNPSALRNVKWGYLFLAALLAGVVFVSTRYDLYIVESGSMKPALQPGEVLLSRRTKSIPWSRGAARYNAIVVVSWSGEAKETFIKRVVGLGGDRIRIKGGTLVRNGQAVDEPYVWYPSAVVKAADTWPRLSGLSEVTVPKGHVFLLGDNRAESVDARVFGSLPESRIFGVVERHVWIPERIGRMM